MRLKSLWIDGFKNLNDFKIDFEKRDGITVLIGNNASGKSNILEAISAIFAGLYNAELDKLDFKFDLIYNIHNADIRISKKQKIKYRIKKPDNTSWSVSKNFYELGFALSGKTTPQTLKNYHPSRVITLYSGEELRLWEEHYKPSYLKYNRKSLSSDTYLHKLDMLYINKYYWDIALLTMFASDLGKVLYTIIKSPLNEIKIQINTKLWSNFIQEKPNNEVNNFLYKLMEYEINGDGLEDTHQFNLNLDEFKDRADYKTHLELFNILSVARLPKDESYKLITDLELTFKNGTTTKDLSEGQKKQILLKLALDVLADENSLLLFDEPDAHIHISNKKLIPEMLKDYGNREIILTTHSPTLAHSFDNKHLAYVENGKINTEYNNKEKLLNTLTNGLMGVSEQQILLQSNKDIVLLVEGNTDKTHIKTALEKLKSSYLNLEFDIFSMAGCQNIKQFILGVKQSNIFDNNKTCIAIFDTDKDGVSCHEEVNGKTKDNSNFHSIRLSEDKNFEIEHMYPIDKQCEAYKEALQDFCENDDNKNINIAGVEKLAKSILGKNCKNFKKSDFESFKILFNNIIKKQNVNQ